ncbi:MAG: hypothetical protein LBO09_02480 [Candidatus Peribacteria bacterium]|nr:hypothetical protein [Candidatus Peribacteria bacterium]
MFQGFFLLESLLDTLYQFYLLRFLKKAFLP